MSFNQNGLNPQDREQLERLIRDILSNSKAIILGLLVLLCIPAIFGSFYTVQPDEEAVVLRFGQYLKTTSPGLHFKLPFGIDKSIKMKTKLILQEEFGFRTRSTQGKRTTYNDKGYDGESLMLTGDLNVADVEWITQFQISDPKKVLFHIRDPIENIRDISEAIMRRVVGDRLVNDVLTVGRTEIAAEAKSLTQEIFDRYDIGIRVVSIKLQDVNPPQAVKASFNEVNQAKQEQEQLINQAEKHYNKVIPEARGLAEQKIAEAEGYATALINRAKGDAERFTAVLKEYRRAPKITRERMYLEKMEQVLGKMTALTLIDSDVKGVLPVFGSLNSREGGAQ